MERYIRKYQEQSEDEPNEEVVSLINRLQKESFGNENQRREFTKIITQIALHNDKIAREFIRELGKFCNEYKMKHEE